MAMTSSGRGRKLVGWLQLTTSGLLALAAWGLATMLFTRPELKALVDLSPQARFTVQPATKELLATLRQHDQQVELHTIYIPTANMPTATPEQRYQRGLTINLQQLTRDLLRQYEYLGGDAVRVVDHDLLNEPKQAKEELEAIGQRQYGSVIVKLGKRSKVLSIFDDLAQLDVPVGQAEFPGAPKLPTLKSYRGEEAISTAIKRLMVEGRPKVYFVGNYSYAPLAEGIASSYSALVSALIDDGFEVAPLDLEKTGKIPADAAVLALMQIQRPVPDAIADTLVSWVRRGGRMLLNVSYIQDPPDWNPDLRSLGERLGFSLSDELVCHPVPDPQNPQAPPVDGTPAVQNLTIVNLNPVHPVTRPLLRADPPHYPLLKAGREVRALDQAPDGVRVDTSFLRTGPLAWLEERDAQGNIDYSGPPVREAYAPRAVGAVIDVDPSEGKREGEVVVLAAAGFENQGFRYNRDLALNIFNWMAERDALVSVRGHSYVSRELKLTPQQFDRVFWLLVVGVPGTMLLLGLGVFWRRSRA